MNAGMGRRSAEGGERNLLVPVQPFEVANCLTARMHKGINTTVDEGQTPVLHVFTVDGQVADPVSASEGKTYTHEGAGNFRLHNCVGQAMATSPQTLGGNRGELVDGACEGAGAVPAGTLRGVRQPEIGGASSERGLDGSQPSEPAAAVQELPPQGASVGASLHAVLETAQGTRPVLKAPAAAEEMGQPRAGEDQPVDASDGGRRDAASEAVLGAGMRSSDACEVLLRQARAAGATRDAWQAANNAAGEGADALAQIAVRRLMPVECERLQGFPDDWTLVPYRGKPMQDGPRYKAIGNSWCVFNARWIGRRMDLLEQLCPSQP